MKNETNTVTRYNAVWLAGAVPTIQIGAASFKRTPKLWMRLKDDVKQEWTRGVAWGYQTVFPREPGFASPEEAVSHLVEREQRALEIAQKRLRVAETHLAQLQAEAQQEKTND
jgi:hypothetical protein